jgi:hypothetical protein
LKGTKIFSIQKPRYSIFKLFDTLFLVAGSRCIYHGPAIDVLPFFESVGFRCEEHDNQGCQIFRIWRKTSEFSKFSRPLSDLPNSSEFSRFFRIFPNRNIFKSFLFIMIFDIFFDRFPIAPSLFSYFHWIIHFILTDKMRRKRRRNIINIFFLSHLRFVRIASMNV